MRAILGPNPIPGEKWMRVRLLLIIAVVLLGCFVLRTLAQDRMDEAGVRALESKFSDAYKQRQASALASLLAEDYVITMEDGAVYSKIGFISYNMGPLRVDSAELSDLRVRLHDNVAVVTGAYHERGQSSGKPYDFQDRLTDVWMRTGGKWQLIASHYSLPSKQ